MSDDTENSEPTETDPKKSTIETVKSTTQKAVGAADKVSNVAEVANNAFGAIKWVSIAVVTLLVFSFGWGAYKMVTKPVAAVGDAAGAVVDAVGDGAGAIKDGADKVINRLDILITNQRALNQRAETAFPILNDMSKTKADGMRDRMFRKTSFPGSADKICKLTVNFGTSDVIAFAAADNDGYETVKALGSKDQRLIRFVIKAPKDDIEFNTAWDSAAKSWGLKWKKTVVNKPINDAVAEARILDLLKAIPAQCGGPE